jgi:molybdopterin-guanine dinucleotide biosynthesis protein A
MEDYKKIGSDVKECLFNIYKKPVDGFNTNGVKGGIKGMGSALGSVVEKCFVVPVDLTCVTYNLISNNLSNDKKSNDEKSNDEK